jgi:hypothetical protein
MKLGTHNMRYRKRRWKKCADPLIKFREMED